MINETRGDRIRRLRKAKKQSMTRAAEIAGISIGFLHDIENDRRGMSAATLYGIAKTLGTTMEYILVGNFGKAKEQGNDYR